MISHEYVSGRRFSMDDMNAIILPVETPEEAQDTTFIPTLTSPRNTLGSIESVFH